MENIKITNCMDTLNKQRYEREKIKIIWQWIKESHITLNEYVIITEKLFKDSGFAQNN